jgi:uncharacterized membrane protein YhaH (DUF805 family)
MKSLLFSFSGRINRAKFWLASIAVGVVEMIVVFAIFGAGMMSGDPSKMDLGSTGVVGIIVVVVVYIVGIWVSLALAAKRWHDRGKSAWWIFIILVPLVGGVWYFIEVGCLKGTTGPNTYGPDPLATA